MYESTEGIEAGKRRPRVEDDHRNWNEVITTRCRNHRVEGNCRLRKRCKWPSNSHRRVFTRYGTVFLRSYIQNEGYELLCHDTEYYRKLIEDTDSGTSDFIVGYYYTADSGIFLTIQFAFHEQECLWKIWEISLKDWLMCRNFKYNRGFTIR